MIADYSTNGFCSTPFKSQLWPFSTWTLFSYIYAARQITGTKDVWNRFNIKLDCCSQLPWTGLQCNPCQRQSTSSKSAYLFIYLFIHSPTGSDYYSSCLTTSLKRQILTSDDWCEPELNQKQAAIALAKAATVNLQNRSFYCQKKKTHTFFEHNRKTQ